MHQRHDIADAALRLITMSLATLALAAPAAADTEVRAGAEIFAAPLTGFAADSQRAVAGPLADPDAAVTLDDAAPGYDVSAAASASLPAAELRVFMAATSAAGNPPWNGPPGMFGPDPVAETFAQIDEYLTFSGPPGASFTIDFTLDFDEANDSISEQGADMYVDVGLVGFENGDPAQRLADFLVDTALFETNNEIADLAYTSREITLDGSGAVRVRIIASLFAVAFELDAGPASGTVDFGATGTVSVAVSNPAVGFVSDSGQFLAGPPDPLAVPASPRFAVLLLATVLGVAARRAALRG